MREIKFRAWDGRQMWYEDSKTVDGNNVSFHFYNSKGNNIGWGIYDNVLGSRVVTGDPKAMFNTPGKLMQFTGLKDKNGIDLYEGDIVDRYHLTGEVVYHNERAMFIVRDWFNEPLYQDILGIEIIGNIYESPELLTK